MTLQKILIKFMIMKSYLISVISRFLILVSTYFLVSPRAEKEQLKILKEKGAVPQAGAQSAGDLGSSFEQNYYYM